METTFTVKDPDSIEFTITATFKLKEWKQIAKQLEDSKGYIQWPASEWVDDIFEMEQLAEKDFARKD